MALSPARSKFKVRGARLFPAPEGGPIHDGTFRNRIWYPALLRVGLCPEHGKLKNPSMTGFRERHQLMVDCPVCEPVPFYPPRVLRHTAASLLLRAGVPKDEVKALLGHTTTRTTGIYAQFAPGELPQIEGAWERRRDARDARASHAGDTRNARVAHGEETDGPACELTALG